MSACPALGIAICDAELRYVAVNSALAAMNGIPAEAHIGKTLREIIGPIAQRVELILRYTLFSGRSILNYEVSGELPTRSEEGFWIVNYFPIRDSTGGIKQVGILVTEITRLRRLEQSILALMGSMPRTRGEIAHLGMPYSLEKESVGFWSGSIEKVENSVREMLKNSHSLQLLAQTPNTGGIPTHQRIRPYCVPTAVPVDPLGQKHRSTPIGDSGAKPLSPREKEVVQLLARGKSNKEISAALNISVKTVETYRAKILLKLQLHSTGDLVMYGVRHGLVKV